MKSPVGKRCVMQKTNLEDGLVAYECPDTKGIYITLEGYWNWLKKQPERLAHLPVGDEGSCVIETEAKAKICPESGTIMMRCKVGHDFDFYIDRSRTGGVWLDAGEWESLKSRNFHDELHLIFTEPWQQQVRDQQAQKMTAKMLDEKLGAELLLEIENIKSKLKDHPHKDFAIAYLDEM